MADPHRTVPEAVNQSEEAGRAHEAKVMRPVVERDRLPWEPHPGASPDGVGIALSGGGLRAAAFSLGVLQVLQERRLLLFGPKPAKYMTAVSGGSYVAASYMLSGLDRQEFPSRYATQAPLSEGSPEERHILKNGNFLKAGLPTIALYFVLNLAALASLFVWSGAMIGDYTFLSDFRRNGVGPAWLADLQGWVEGLNPMLAVAVLTIAWAAVLRIWLRIYYADRGWGYRTLGLIPLLAFIALVAPAVRAADALGLAFLLVLPLALGGLVVVGAAKSMMAGRPANSDSNADTNAALVNLALLLAPRLLGLMLLLSLSVLTVNVVFNGTGTEPVAAFLFFVGALVMAVIFMHVPHRASLHRNYRDLLMTCFGVMRRGDSVEGSIDVPLTRLASHWTGTQRFPRLIVAATANVRAPRRGDQLATFVPFLMSHDSSGVPGYSDAQFDTAKLELIEEPRGLITPGREPLISLFTAVAIAGAAVSPSMGRFTTPSLRFMAVAFNARLGRWMPNVFRPDMRRRVTELSRRGPLKVPRKFGAGYDDMIPELVDVDGARMYVSDGGHYDNLGLLALLRTKPAEIWSVDSSDDRKGLAEELRRVRLVAFADMDIDLDIDLDAFQIDDQGLYRTSVAVGSVRYADNTRATLHILKLGLTPKSSEHLLAARGSDRGFPHHKTFPHQFYSYDRMNNYRLVGREVASAALHALDNTGTPT